MSEAENQVAVEAQPAAPTGHKCVLWLEIRIWNDLSWSSALNREKTARVAIVNTDALKVSRENNGDADTTDEEAEEEQEPEVDDAEILSDLPDNIDVRFDSWGPYHNIILMRCFTGNKLDSFETQHRYQIGALEVYATQ